MVREERRGRRRGKNEGMESRALLGVIVVFVSITSIKEIASARVFMNVFCLVNMTVFPSHPTQLTSNALYQMTILTAVKH